MNQDTHPPGWRIPKAPPPPGTPRAPPRNLATLRPLRERITCCATAVRRVPDISTTSARHSATACQCKRRDVTLPYARRIGRGWGSTSPHRSSRRGGKTRRYPAGIRGRVVPQWPQWGSGARTQSTHVLSHRSSEGAKGGARWAAQHACSLISAPGPAARAGRGGRRHSSMFLALVLLTLGLHAMPTVADKGLGGDLRGGGGGARPHPLTPYRSCPVLVTAVMAATRAPASPPLGRPQGPDALPGRGVSICPQPMRGPREEVMALGLGGGNQPGRWQGAPRRSGVVAVWQRAQPPRRCDCPSHRE